MANWTRRQVLSGSASLAGLAMGNVLSFGTVRAADRPDLPIPVELRADSKGVIRLRAQRGEVVFRPGVKTPTFGVNGPYLGPAVRVRRGDTVVMDVTNALDQDITMHWHGLEIPGDVDGGPYSLIRPGSSWKAQLAIDQPAATCWFHPHVYPTTAELVVKGLAGLFLIDDEEADALPLPKRWGVDDIPVVLQDRRFNTDGTIFHRFNLPAVTTGYVGDTVLVNGARYPQARTARGWLRLRLLNGSNARTFRLALSDNRPMFVVGSDGGLLANPVELEELVLYAGERYEVLVDGRDGTAFDLVTRPVDQMAMKLPPFDRDLPLLTLRPDGAEGSGTLPDTLVTLPPLVADLPPVSQQLVMGMRLDDKGMAQFRSAGLMDMDKSGHMDPAVVEKVVKLIVGEPALPIAERLGANDVNGAPFELGVVPIHADINRDLRWLISEGDDRMYHPVHIHGCQFRILKLDGKAPPEHMAGWKDMAPVLDGGSCEIQVRFRHPATKEFPFMAHCHNLEHEDSGMMTDFTVS